VLWLVLGLVLVLRSGLRLWSRLGVGVEIEAGL
jgi:hypothetical protein